MENVAFQRVRYFVRLYFPRRVWLAGRIAFSPFLKMLHYLYYYCYLKFGDFHIYYPVLGFFFLRCCFFHIQRKWHLFGCKFLKRFLFLPVATSVLAPSVFVLISCYIIPTEFQFWLSASHCPTCQPCLADHLPSIWIQSDTRLPYITLKKLLFLVYIKK